MRNKRKFAKKIIAFVLSAMITISGTGIAAFATSSAQLDDGNSITGEGMPPEESHDLIEDGQGNKKNGDGPSSSSEQVKPGAGAEGADSSSSMPSSSEGELMETPTRPSSNPPGLSGDLPASGEEAPVAPQNSVEGGEKQQKVALISPLESRIEQQKVAVGSSLDELNLPEQLEAQGEEGNPLAIPVSWKSEPEFNGSKTGNYLFTSVLSEGYILAEGVSLPSIAVEVYEEQHIHTEDCYTKGGELLCKLPEDEDHTHSGECYAKGGELVCGYEALNAPEVYVDNPVAFVDGTGYTALDAACEAAKASGVNVIVLAEGAVIEDVFLTVDSKITIQFDSSTIQASDGRCAFYVVDGGDLTLEGTGTVNGSTGKFGIFYLVETGKVTLKDHVTIQDFAGSEWASAINLYGTAAFNMEGGTIQNTSAKNGGGALNANGNSSFKMTGGVIQNTSTTWYGGAVYVGTGASFEMAGGTIQASSAAPYGYGGGIYIGGTATLSGGTISDCRAANGGGVYLKEGSSFTMTDGVIQYSESSDDDYNSQGGGGVLVTKGATFAFTGGDILGNTAAEQGGGVCNEGTFIMEGGQIVGNQAVSSENYARSGGGVYNIGDMKMSGGVITGNVGESGLDSYNGNLEVTGGMVYRNPLGIILYPSYLNELDYIDIVLRLNLKEGQQVSVCPASDMNNEDYTFSGWEMWGYGEINDSGGTGLAGGEILTGNLLPSSFDKKIKGPELYFVAAVDQEPDTEVKEGVYLGGSTADDTNTGESMEQAVATFARAKELAEAKAEQLENGEILPIYVGGAIKVSQAEDWNLSENIQLKRAPDHSGYLIHVEKGGELTLKNITVDGNRAEYGYNPTNSLICVEEGALHIGEGAVLRNNLAGERLSISYEGGAVYCKAGKVTMTGGRIEQNESTYLGGGISLSAKSVFTMTGGVIEDNKSQCGGGVSGVRGSRVYIQDGARIQNNRANDGGGIHLGGSTGAEATGYGQQTLKMTGGTVYGNMATNCGGGIFVQMNSVAAISGGTIQNNSTESGGNVAPFRGGGIYVNGGKQAGYQGPDGIPNGLLKLYNVEIANNEATHQGGGLAACPTANVKIYLANGGVFHDNQSQIDIATEIYIEENEAGGSTYVSDYMLGGGMYHWLWEQKGQDKVRPEQSKYQNTTEAVYLDNIYAQEDIEQAKKQATTFITENKGSSNGGGIATNGDVIIGEAPTEKGAGLQIAKEWDDDNKTGKRPESILVDVQYGAYTLEGIPLTKDNGWTFTMENLSNEMLEQQNPETKVLEVNVDGYELKEDSIQAEVRDRTIFIHFTNRLAPESGALQVHKTVTGNRGSLSKNFTFTVVLSDESVNGLYGKMIFENGKATFTLKHGESKDATGLPAGIGYTVTESGNDGYSVSSTGAIGTIPAGGTAQAHFTNHRSGGGGGEDDEIDVAVKKVWKLDDGRKRPESVRMELLRNGEHYDWVTLSEENGWRYTWRDLDDSYSWSVREGDIPEGFLSSIDRRGNTWTVTNDDIPEDVPELPKTGLNWMLPLTMGIAGASSMVYGSFRRRKYE